MRFVRLKFSPERPNGPAVPPFENPAGSREYKEADATTGVYPAGIPRRIGVFCYFFGLEKNGKSAKITGSHFLDSVLVPGPWVLSGFEQHFGRF